MKPKNILIRLTLIALAIVFISLVTDAGAVVNWTKQNNGNAVMTVGNPGAWDAGKIERPAVIKDGSFKMWYSGAMTETGSGNTRYIGRALSGDGISWTKDATYVLSPSSGASAYQYQDRGHVGFCSVMNAGGGTYKMWYSGTPQYSDYSSELPGVTGYQIFYATSTDGGVNWSKYTNAVTPVVTRGWPGSWDADMVAGPSVIYESGASPAYKMWYLGYSNTYAGVSGYTGIGYATSSDGVNWTKRSSPVLYLGPAGAFDAASILFPTVIKDGAVYCMWFEGDGTGNYHEAIGYAYSMDGINWTKYVGNPVLMGSPSGSGKFDDSGASDPIVLKDGNTYRMWYVGWNPNGFGYATSPAYPAGGHLRIKDAQVSNRKNTSGTSVFLQFVPEGPSPLDITEMKVTWPNSGVSWFTQANITNMAGSQFPAYAVNLPPGQSTPSGTYTFSVTANNGETATKQLVLTASDLPVLQDGHADGYLYRHIEVSGATTYAGTQEYISATTPTFRWKPSAGDNRYYRVVVRDWKQRVNYFLSDVTLGSTKAADGYMSVTVPSGVLKWNTPYYWMVLAFDTGEVWSAKNDSMSDMYGFYTGTKSTTSDFLADAYGEAAVTAMRSFSGGDQTRFNAIVANLAPWDIDTTSNQFRVEKSGVSPFLIDPYNPSHIYMGDGHPFLYAPFFNGIPADGTYTFYVYEKNTSNYDTASISITAATPYQITKLDMSPADNAYLSGTSFVLSWTSKGDAYYRARIFDWNRNRQHYASNWLPGGSPGTTLSVSVPAGILNEYSPYCWWVESADSTRNSNTVSNRLSFMTGRGPAGEDAMVSWGTNKLAGVFTRHGSESGLWSYDGSSWTHLTNWLPDKIVSWGSDNLAVSFSNYGSGNGIWSYNGSSWCYLSSWVPTDLKAWGGAKLAATFTNHDTPYGSGNGIWSYNGSSWSHLTNWLPQDMEAWGSSNLAASFPSYTDGGIWSFNGSSWGKLTNWVPRDMEGWGTGKLAASFPGYTDGGIWSFNGSTWQKLTAWVPDEMVSWSSGNLAASFSTYSDGGIWSYNGTSWGKLTNWVPQGMDAWGSANLAGSFPNYSDGGVWSYNGTFWSKLTNWVPERAAPWGGTNLAGCFGDYTDNGIWSYNGTSWIKLTNWIPE